MEYGHFAIIFENEERANEARQVLRKLHRQRHLNLNQMYVIVRDAEGKYVSEGDSDFNPVNPRYGLAGLAGGIAGLIGAAPLGPGALVMGAFMGGVGTTAAMGLDLLKKGLRESGYQQTEAGMPPGSSAVIVQAEFVNLAEVLNEMAELGRAAIVPLNLSPSLHRQLASTLKN